jgi:hypothetical protein
MRRFRVGISVLLVAVAARAQSVPTSGLVGHWSADGSAADSSSFANNGSFTGTYGAGISGQAFQISANYVSIPEQPQYSFTTGFSVGFWFYGSVGGVFLGQDNGGGSQLKWFVDYGYINGGTFNLHLNGPSLVVLPSNAVAPSSNAWHSFALVKSGTSYTFYLDGASIGNTTNSYNPFPDPGAPFTIGYSESAVPQFGGLIDEVVLYDRALTTTEVQQLSSIPEPATTALFAASLGLVAAATRRRISRARLSALCRDQ